MLKKLQIENFTVFPKADLDFGKNLNIILGENGAGKSHLLKLAYSAIAVSAQRSKDGGDDPLGKAQIQTVIADKLRSVFRPDGLWRLVSRTRGRSKCRLRYGFDDPKLNLVFTFSTVAKTEVTVETVPTAKVRKLPVFLPTRELLTIYPGFVSLYETTHLPFEETWRDTCVLLGAPLARGPRLAAIRRLLAPLEEQLDGKVVLEEGRFSITTSTGNLEAHLVAEGLRKLAMI